jgi:hypothetical protein
VPDTVTACTLVPAPHRACAGAGVPDGDAVAAGLPLADRDGDAVADALRVGVGDFDGDLDGDGEALGVRLTEAVRLADFVGVPLPLGLRLRLGVALGSRDRDRDCDADALADRDAAAELAAREAVAPRLRLPEPLRDAAPLALAAADGGGDCGRGDGEAAGGRNWQQAPKGALSSQLAVRAHARSFSVLPPRLG